MLKLSVPGGVYRVDANGKKYPVMFNKKGSKRPNSAALRVVKPCPKPATTN